MGNRHRRGRLRRTDRPPDPRAQAYGDQITATPHKYILEHGAEYLTFVPLDSTDANYRLVMETKGDVVTQIRAGILPSLEQVEGCQ